MDNSIPNPPIRALLVEDDHESAEAVRVMLERRDVSTCVFHSAEQAFPRFSPEAFDVVVTDIRLKGMTGVDLLRRIRANHPDFPVILLTGYDSLTSAIEAVRLGAQDYILKPLDSIDDILNPIQKAVHAYRLLLRNRILEEELRLSEARFRTVLENSIDIAFQLDLETNMLDYVSPSAAKLLGCADNSPQTFHVSRFLERIHPDDQPGLSALVQDLPHGLEPQAASPVPVPCRLRKGNGEFCWLSINYRVVTGEHDRPIAVVGTARDVSEVRRIQEQEDNLKERLARAERMESIGVLAGGVAHDLNNVMWSLVGLPELLLWELEDAVLPDTLANSLRKGLTTIESSARRATEIFKDLLALSRSGHYRMHLKDMNEVVGAYILTSEHEELKASHPDTTITTTLCRETAGVNGSQTHLHRVILNLVINALDAMPSGGALELSTQRVNLDKELLGYEAIPKGDYVVLKVKDSGTGIHQQHIGKIFEPFYTQKELGKRSGTGLGLAVVHGVMKDHGGYVDVKSEIGMGTTFSLYFPAVKQPFPVKPAGPLPQIPEAAKALVDNHTHDIDRPHTSDALDEAGRLELAKPASQRGQRH